MCVKGFELENEMTIHSLDKNLKIKNVIIEYRDRPERKRIQIKYDFRWNKSNANHIYTLQKLQTTKFLFHYFTCYGSDWLGFLYSSSCRFVPNRRN